MRTKFYVRMCLGVMPLGSLLKKPHRIKYVKDFNTPYVEKIWSLNPTKHKFIPLDLALRAYRSYFMYCANTNSPVKSFDIWLKTEI